MKKDRPSTAELLYHRKLNLSEKEVVRDNVNIFLENYKLDTAFGRLKKVEVDEVPDKYRGYFVRRDQYARQQYSALRANQGGVLPQDCLLVRK